MKNFTISPLGEVMQEMKDSGYTLDAVTVLSEGLDPYRKDTKANHARAQWLATEFEKLNLANRIHLRGLHYALVGNATLPDGRPYVNDDDTWKWMSEKCSTAARWLGYIPWSSVRDNRNSPPIVLTPEYEPPRWQLSTGEVEILLPDTLEPQFSLAGDMTRQKWRQVVLAEKQGVEDLLLPVCQRYKATLAMPTGEVSSQMVYDLLAAAYHDNRDLVIHQLGDFDPAGWQMAVSTARKVQAFMDGEFDHAFRVKVQAIGLNIEHCESWDLPTSPLKKTEQRGTKWKAKWGREQTELDAAVVKVPGEFSRMVATSLDQYWDSSLRDRGVALRAELEETYNAKLIEQIGEEQLDKLRELAEEQLGDLEALTDDLNAQLRIDPDELDMEQPPEPESSVLIGDTEEDVWPLIDTYEDWDDNTLALKDRKAYV